MYWIAHYRDGSSASQAEGAAYQQLDRGNLQAFDLWQDNRLMVRVDLRDNDTGAGIEPRRLIWRKRGRVNSAGEQMAVHLVGWQRRVNGRNVQAINYVFEDGIVVLGGQFTNQDFMDEIVPLECEADLK